MLLLLFYSQFHHLLKFLFIAMCPPQKNTALLEKKWMQTIKLIKLCKHILKLDQDLQLEFKLNVFNLIFKSAEMS